MNFVLSICRTEKLRPSDPFYKKKPVDDVYFIEDYPPKHWSFRGKELGKNLYALATI